MVTDKIVIGVLAILSMLLHIGDPLAAALPFPTAWASAINGASAVLSYCWGMVPPLTRAVLNVDVAFFFGLTVAAVPVRWVYRRFVRKPDVMRPANIITDRVTRSTAVRGERAPVSDF